MGDGLAAPVVLQMTGVVHPADQTGAIEHVAAVTGVAHRAVVDAVRPGNLLLPGEGLGGAVIGGVIEGAWQKRRARDVWLITSCRSANNIMPITFFLPAFIASSFYSA